MKSLRIVTAILLLALCTARADITFTPVIVVATASGTIAAGKQHIEFILSSNFAGTIQGATFSGASVSVYSPGEPQRGTFSAVTYTITAGSATITTW